MLSSKSGQRFSEWVNSGKLQIAEFLETFKKRHEHRDLIGLSINPQYLKLMQIKQVHSEYEVEYFKVTDIPEGLMSDLEIRNSEAIADILKEMIRGSGLENKDVVLAIPRSSTIVKTITVDHRLHQDEIESRVWLEMNRLFPDLIGDIYLDFAITGVASQDATQLEVLIVACRKEQLKPYLDIMRYAGLTAKVVDVNYYAYERALSLIIKRTPEIKNVAFLSINFSFIDLLGVHDGKLIYTNESTYDGRSLLKFRRSGDSKQENPDNTVLQEALKNTIGLHLKHAIQFFYSSRPNVRLDRIILGGDVPATIPGALEYVRQEVGKETIMADPFVEMKLSANVDKEKLQQYAPALMACCGLAIAKADILQK